VANAKFPVHAILLVRMPPEFVTIVVPFSPSSFDIRNGLAGRLLHYGEQGIGTSPGFALIRGQTVM